MNKFGRSFLKTGLKETDFQTVSGDPQTKVNAVINKQADLVLGYPMDQGMNSRCHRQARVPDQVR